MESISSSRGVDQSQQASVSSSKKLDQPPPEALAAAAQLLASAIGELGGALAESHQHGSAEATGAAGKSSLNPTQTAMLGAMKILHSEIKQLHDQLKQSQSQMWSSS